MLVLGGTGFVGSYINAALGSKYDVYLAGHEVDVRNAECVRELVALHMPDEVMHLAAISSVGESFQDPGETYQVNFLGTLNLLSALKDGGFRGRMLYVGSSDTYGLVDPASLPVVEGFPLKPRNPYAVSKVAAEALCYQWSQTEPFEVVMVRPFNHIGPGQSERFVISDFARQVVEIKGGLRPSLIRVGDIDVTRDFTDVRDVVRAYALLLERGGNGEVYNVCSGQERSVLSVLELLLRLAGVEAEIVQDAERLRKSEQRRVFGSFAKLHEATGWQPEIPFEQSLKDILTDWEKKLL